MVNTTECGRPKHKGVRSYKGLEEGEEREGRQNVGRGGKGCIGEIKDIGFVAQCLGYMVEEE